MRVTVIGTGYVGLVTGACLAYLGNRVTCVDTDHERIKRLRSGQVPIYEPHLDEFLGESVRNGLLDFSEEGAQPVEESDVVFITVGTPPSPSGAPDLRFLEAAARSVGEAIDISRRPVIVNKSTVPVGSGNLVEALIDEGYNEAHGSEAPRAAFSVVSNPEFLQEGSAIANSLYPDRIVIGAERPEAIAVMEALYRPLIEQSFTAPDFLPRPDEMARAPFFTTSLTSAEMIKYAANSFLAMKISFANEMSNICERVGAECRDVMKGIGLDTRIGGKFLNAGVGWGGSCFGKDLQALTNTALEYGYQPLLLEAAQEVNRRQRQVVVQKLQEKLRILKGRTIGLWGLAFKPETDDLRDAPSLTIAARLLELGARVKVYDPIAMPACRQQNPNLKLQYCDSPYAVARGADAVVLVTEWKEFRTLDLEAVAQAMNQLILVDGRSALNPEEARRAGFDYFAIGSGQLNHPYHYRDSGFFLKASA